MALIPPRGDATLMAIDKILEDELAAEPKRNYLGASSLGDSCERKLWYRLHTSMRETFPASTIRKFNDGHRCEAEMAALLRKVPGVRLWTHIDADNQYGFEDHTLGPKPLSGHYDGVIIGILEAPKTFHIWEHKATNEKKYLELKKLKAINEKAALRAWNPVYYAQAVINMHYENLTRHYMTVSTPGLREYLSIRTEDDPVYAEALKIKARRIINSKELPERIGGKDYYECKWCGFYDACHNGDKQ